VALHLQGLPDGSKEELLAIAGPWGVTEQPTHLRNLIINKQLVTILMNKEAKYKI